MTLKEIDMNQIVRVKKIHLAKEKRERLFFIGIYPGAFIKRIANAPLHDPSIYLVRGVQIILRAHEAVQIDVEVI